MNNRLVLGTSNSSNRFSWPYGKGGCYPFYKWSVCLVFNLLLLASVISALKSVLSLYVHAPCLSDLHLPKYPRSLAN